jgi:hypothetical protein
VKTLARAQRRSRLPYGSPQRVYRARARADPAVRALLRAPPAAQRACADCEEEKKVQRSATSPATRGADASSAVAAGTASGGAPLPAAARHHFEPRFGRDFGDVRVHTGAEAADSARELNAYAYTFGRDVVFGAGQYDPGSSAGRRLIAHELAHVVQQDAAPELGRRALRQPIGCTPEQDKRIVAAQAAAETAMKSAFQSLNSLDEGKLAIIDRHFECPSPEAIDKISGKLVTARGKVASIIPICHGATEEPCTSQREISSNGKLLFICSTLFPTDEQLKERFIRSAVSEDVFHDPPALAALALELEGATVPASSTKACASQEVASRLRGARRLISGIGDPPECPFEGCAGREESIRADIERALSNIGQTISALGGKISGRTEDMLDFYFSSHSAATVNIVRDRLDCIRKALVDTLDTDRYGCGVFGPTAKTGGSTGICKDTGTTICLNTAIYFDDSAGERAGTFIHEAGHRVGLATKERDLPDIYSWKWEFRELGNASALENTDSYAEFVGAIVYGTPRQYVASVGADLGATTQGPLLRLNVGLEMEHPRLGSISPTARLSGAWLGSSDFMGSLLLGVRLADPRPGEKGGIYLNLAGGIAMTKLGDDFGFGAAAEAKVGVRIGRWDAGIGAGIVQGPKSAEGDRQTIYTGTAGVSFLFEKF